MVVLSTISRVPRLIVNVHVLEHDIYSNVFCSACLGERRKSLNLSLEEFMDWTPHVSVISHIVNSEYQCITCFHST